MINKLMAADIFKSLGYEKVVSNEEYIVYLKGNSMISFNMNESKGTITNSNYLTIDCLKAINKQCEELGWIEFKHQTSLESNNNPKHIGEWCHLGGDEWCCSECGLVVSTEGSWEHPSKKGYDFCYKCGMKMKQEPESWI